ncbi:MAG TPA: beta-N-acetylhexosaminidase N-terminal domain-containing protein, partial [Blastocatellia bacterium]|nr:beta-N-acetylhexosaminidase N-terminal domain-containing protein [Blastocatellia bacterium]
MKNKAMIAEVAMLVPASRKRWYTGAACLCVLAILGGCLMADLHGVSASGGATGTSSTGKLGPAETQPGATHNLMPVPASIQFRPGRLIIDSSFTVAVTGVSDNRLLAALDRARVRLQERTGITTSPSLAESPGVATLVIKCDSASKPYPSVDDDESYALDVSSRQATLSAPSVYGAMHGLETLLQLVEHDPEGYFITSVSIQDKPRFRWRGLMIDVGRHFQPVEVIKRNLDG